LLRDLIGNPFRPSRVEAAWLTPDVVRLAKLIYDEGQFGEMPYLADALLDAGCTDEAMLEHCRGRQPHYRGCWVIDLVLGVECREGKGWGWGAGAEAARPR